MTHRISAILDTGKGVVIQHSGKWATVTPKEEVLCDIDGCDRRAAWAVCMKEDPTDRMEVAVLKVVCERHVRMAPSYHQMIAVWDEQMDINTEERLKDIV